MTHLAFVLTAALLVLAALTAKTIRHADESTSDDQSAEDETFLGRRPGDDSIFGTYPNLRVPDSIPPHAWPEISPSEGDPQS